MMRSLCVKFLLIEHFGSRRRIVLIFQVNPTRVDVDEMTAILLSFSMYLSHVYNGENLSLHVIQLTLLTTYKLLLRLIGMPLSVAGIWS